MKRMAILVFAAMLLVQLPAAAKAGRTVCLSDAGRANCYIVTAPGRYCFDATQIGNGAEGILPEGHFHTAEASIQPASALILMNQGKVVSDVQLLDGKIYFKASKALGNAVIAACDAGGNVLWSWHIWRTGTPSLVTLTTPDRFSFTLMDRNLGAVSARPEDGAKTYGLYYQWGRKDPFEADEVASAMADNSGRSLAYAVQHPRTPFGIIRSTGIWDAWDWLAANYNDVNHYLWGNPDFVNCHRIEDLQKTIYDPCPAGYMVPPANAYLQLSDAQRLEYLEDGAVFTADDGTRSWFPFAGRAYDDGVVGRAGGDGEPVCGLWESATGYFYYFNDGGSRMQICRDRRQVRQYYGGIRAHCYPVRCVRIPKPSALSAPEQDAFAGLASVVLGAGSLAGCDTATLIPAMGYLGFRDKDATLANFQKLAEAGISIFTVDMDQPSALKQLDMAAQVGIKVMAVMMYYGEKYMADPDNYKGLEQVVLKIKDHPALYGYHIYDEPSITLIPKLNLVKNKIESLDPVHPVYINLNPLGSQNALGTDYYPDFVETYARECNLKLLSYDFYPVLPTGVITHWYHCNEAVAAVCRKYNIPFWGFTATCLIDREPGNLHAKPDMANLRLQAYTNLAYGAQVIEYFTIRDFGGSSYAPMMGGEWTSAYDLLKEFNLEMQRRAFVFAGCTVTKTCFTNIAQRSCLLFGNEDLPPQVSALATDHPALVSFIENGDSRYIVLVNESCWEGFNARLKLSSEVDVIGRDGKAVRHSAGTASFNVEPGDMLVVKVK